MLTLTIWDLSKRIQVHILVNSPSSFFSLFLHSHVSHFPNYEAWLSVCKHVLAISGQRMLMVMWVGFRGIQK